MVPPGTVLALILLQDRVLVCYMLPQDRANQLVNDVVLPENAQRFPGLLCSRSGCWRSGCHRVLVVGGLVVIGSGCRRSGCCLLPQERANHL